MSGWSELWHQFVVTLTQQPVAVVLAVWTGLALVLVMALEGLILNLFPACVFRRYLEKMPERKAKSRLPQTAPALPAISAPPEPPPSVAIPAPAVAASTPDETPPKRRPFRNPKKPASRRKTARLAIPRRVAPRRERLSRSTPRLLAPKN